LDFHSVRRFQKVSATDIFEGVYLEGLDSSMSGSRPGIVLTHRDWGNIYFVKERKSWGEEEYFDFAQARFHQLGILDP